MRDALKMLRKSLLAAAVIAVAAVSPATAETITGAMSQAYQNNSELNAARAGVRVTDEGVAIAKSGYRPTIAGTSSFNYASQAGNRLTTGSFGVQIQQSLFDGFQTKNNVAAAEARTRSRSLRGDGV